ncbi:MAG: hypothetical protein HY659_04175 [Rhizobiales bacterium]|nr:hypothetical protein [Hyphomicrobiales bacterium]
MTLAATFLGGAKSRLLPPSVPFRFFVSAAVFHVMMWMVLLADFRSVAGYRGGPGPVLAALHLLTLGVLTTTAIGASVQLLPVATRRAFVAVWPIKLVFWLVVPGILVLAVGMYLANLGLLAAGSVVVTAGLIIFAALLGENLRCATGMPAVAAFGWLSLAALLALIALGVALAFDYGRGFLDNHAAAALTHMLLAGFGFMGMLALGFSHILVPMFALAAAPEKRASLAAFALAAIALVVGTAGALADDTPALTLAGIIGLTAAIAHLALMRRVLKDGMRKRLGLSFILVRAAWAMLVLTIVVGIAVPLGYAGANGPTLFAFLLFAGWLLTFLLGILQRIMPFLASMHAARDQRGAPPLLSELAASWPLKCHAICHGLAIAGLASAIAFNLTWLAASAAAIGLAGAIAFAGFTFDVLRRVIATPAHHS